MISAGYVKTMARYNAWQNKQLMRILDAMSEDELRLERGAFFGSIMGTINHLLWADMLWMNRFDPSAPTPPCAAADALTMFPTFGTWSAERFRTDGVITLWAERVKSVTLHGEMTWYSAVMKQDFTRPIATCVAHFFNHQTHHRGQVHMMLTAAGQDAPVSDLILLPKDM